MLKMEKYASPDWLQGSRSWRQIQPLTRLLKSINSSIRSFLYWSRFLRHPIHVYIRQSFNPGASAISTLAIGMSGVDFNAMDAGAMDVDDMDVDLDLNVDPETSALMAAEAAEEPMRMVSNGHCGLPKGLMADWWE